jgi:predicted nucleic acid-binding Zn ribbon protein
MMKKAKKKTEIVHIGNVIDDVLSAYRKDIDGELAQVWRRWNGVVGKAIAENAQPAAFKGRILLVYVSNSTWLHQLQFLKKEILSNLNADLAKTAIEEIKFKIGPIEVPKD